MGWVAMDYKEKLCNDINQITLQYLSNSENQRFDSQLQLILSNYKILPQTKELAAYEGEYDEKMLEMFFVSKKVAGLSDNSLHYYSTVIKEFKSKCPKPFALVSSADIRLFLAKKEIYDHNSPTTLNNLRRVLRSLFAFMANEEYIKKNPVAKIENIKESKRLKKPFTEIEIEKMRSILSNSRDEAIIECLLSTGCRVSELCSIDVEDVNFMSKEIPVIGKGNKERTVFLNAKATFALKKYINDYQIDSGPLFISKKGHHRLTKSGVESLIKKVGQKAHIKNCHPHRFRRTMASLALNRGMPIDQVSKLLGHEDVKTTSIYAITDKESLKEGHRKYVV